MAFLGSSTPGFPRGGGLPVPGHQAPRPQAPQTDPYTEKLKQLNLESAERQGQQEINDISQRNQQNAVNGMMALQQGGVMATNSLGQTSSASPGYGSGGGSRGMQGGGNPLPPNIAGHYMPLIEMQQPTLGGVPPRETMPEADFTPGDATAHQDAAFGRLKASSGQLGRSAVDSLRNELAGRGILGSGTEFRGTADRIASAVQPLADLNVSHLGQEYAASQRARELSENRAQTKFSGDISQRGQDASMIQALNALKAALTQTQYSGELQQRRQGY